MSKNTYWITDPTDGSYALVEGADERDTWVRVHGWAEAEGEPGPTDQVHLRNENAELGPSKLPYQAVREQSAWTANGWAPGAPPEPVNAATAHWSKPEQKTAAKAEKPAAKPESNASSKPASSGSAKE